MVFVRLDTLVVNPRRLPMTATEPTIQSRAAEFRGKLQSKILVADGAMGTMLYSKGIFINRCFDELNLSAPQMVKEIHQEYVKAGAEIIESNTFGGNRVRLTAFGFVEKLKAINQAGVRLAREAAGERAYVAGALVRSAQRSSLSGLCRLARRAQSSKSRRKHC